MISALKKADDQDGIILRLWNTSSQKVNGTISTVLPVKNAAILKLNETIESELKLEHGKIKVSVDPHKL